MQGHVELGPGGTLATSRLDLALAFYTIRRFDAEILKTLPRIAVASDDDDAPRGKKAGTVRATRPEALFSSFDAFFKEYGL